MHYSGFRQSGSRTPRPLKSDSDSDSDSDGQSSRGRGISTSFRGLLAGAPAHATGSPFWPIGSTWLAGGHYGTDTSVNCIGNTWLAAYSLKRARQAPGPP